MAKKKTKTNKAKTPRGPQMVWTGVGMNNLLFGRDKNSVVYTWNFQLGGWVLCKETEGQAKERAAIYEEAVKRSIKEFAEAEAAKKGNVAAGEQQKPSSDADLAKVASQTKRIPLAQNVAQDNGAAEGGEFKLAKRVADPLG